MILEDMEILYLRPLPPLHYTNSPTSLGTSISCHPLLCDVIHERPLVYYTKWHSDFFLDNLSALFIVLVPKILFETLNQEQQDSQKILMITLVIIFILGHITEDYKLLWLGNEMNWIFKIVCENLRFSKFHFF